MNRGARILELVIDRTCTGIGATLLLLVATTDPVTLAWWLAG